MSPVVQLLAFFALFAALFGGLVVVSSLLNRNKETVAAGAEGASLTAAVAAPAPKAARKEGPTRSEKLAELEQRLHRAGILLSPELYRQRVFRTSLLMTLVGMIMGGFSAGGVLFGLLIGFAAHKGGDYYVTFKHQQRMNEFTDQFCDALGVMANGVKSGQTVLQTFETVAEDFTDPIQGELQEVLQELRMGVPMDEALQRWVDRLPNEDLEIATTALIIQRQTGGNVSEILDTLALTIRERNKLHKQIRALTAQGRMSGMVMSLLPVGLFVAMYLIAPQRTGLLLSHPLGLVMTGLGVGGIVLGSYFIKKIVTIEV